MQHCKSACVTANRPVLSRSPLLKDAFPLNTYTTATGSPINVFTRDSVIKTVQDYCCSRELL